MSSPYEYPNGNPGGFHNPKRKIQTPKVNKMKWDAQKDRELMMFSVDRGIAKFEWAIIAAHFPEAPSIKAIQERMVKIRAEQKGLLAAKGIDPRNDALHPANMEGSIASIEDSSDVSETPNLDDTDSIMGGGSTPDLFVPPDHAPRPINNNNFGLNGRKPIGGARPTRTINPPGINSTPTNKIDLSGRKPNSHFTPANKRPHSSTVSSDDTFNRKNSSSSSNSIQPSTKRVRVNLTEPVESVEPLGRPEPNFDWMGGTDCKFFKDWDWYCKKLEKEMAAKDAERKDFITDHAEEFAAWKEKKLAEEVKAADAKETIAQPGGAGGRDGGQGEADLLMHTIGGGGTGGNDAGEEGNRAAESKAEVESAAETLLMLHDVDSKPAE